ncbi:MAG: HAD family hydrolase [Acidobacteriia bacterium]|nr:HAD family hydrolase [Terriglobia bacterium]
MRPARVAAVLFDWDGTLCDSGAAGLRAFEKALEEFGVAFTHAAYKAVYTPAWYRMYEAFGLPPSLWAQADERWLHHYGCERPELMAGAAAVLDALRDRDVRLGIVTSGTRDRIELELTRLGLAATFEAIVCHEDVANRKPHPEGIEKALALLNAAAGDCCFVGDTPEDILMGKSARVFTIGVLSEYVESGRLAACCPDLLLPRIEDLPPLLL